MHFLQWNLCLSKPDFDSMFEVEWLCLDPLILAATRDRYVCWNHVKAHPAMRHLKNRFNGNGKDKESTHTQIAPEPFRNSSNITIWSRGKNWTLILTDQCSMIGNGAWYLMSDAIFSMAGWENGHYLFNLLDQMLECDIIIFQWCVYICICI